VSVAAYAAGVLLLAQGGGEAGRSRLLAAARDLTLPPLGTATGANAAAQGLRETVSELDMVLPGARPSLPHSALLGRAAAPPAGALLARQAVPAGRARGLRSLLRAGLLRAALLDAAGGPAAQSSLGRTRPRPLGTLQTAQSALV